jgi:effector-binding domain-containing protein
MKLLKRIGIGLLAIILLLVIISFFLPREVRVERSVEMNAKPEAPFTLVNNLRMWNEWSPWYRIDSNAVWEFGEVTEGQGAWYSWASEHPEVGKGKLTITESKQDELVQTEVEFAGQGKGTGIFTFAPAGEGVKVTWVMESDMGMNPVGKWMGLFMDKMLGAQFESGLAAMKEAAEKMPPPRETIAGFEFVERDLGPMTVAGIREKVQTSELNGTSFGAWYGAIGQTLKKNKMSMNGHPMAIYYTYENGESDMEAAVPVEIKGKDDGRVKFHDLPASKAIVVIYMGDYSKTGVVYDEAFAYIQKSGRKQNGAPMEIFVTDPMTEKDTAKWVTEIVFPVSE